MDWREQLKNKFNLIKKEGGNVNIGSNTRINNRNSNRRSGDVHLVRNDGKTKINNDKEKGGKGMITVKDALSDLDKLITEAKDESAKTILKAIKVLVKFLSTMRSNQLLTDDDKRRIAIEKEKRIKETSKK